MNTGDTFKLEDYYGWHVHVVLRVLEDGSVILVPLTTRKPRSDTTCVLNPGDHPCIEHETVAIYARADICPGDKTDSIERSIVERFETVSDELLERLCQGALDSPQTIDKVKNLLR